VDAWVVNHLSDSVSVVRINPARPEEARVIGTLSVCDEPRDVVFAGTEIERAFITAARRGRTCAVQADSTDPSRGRAIVQVYEADNPFLLTQLSGNRVATIELFGDTPRALAVSPSRATVYAAVFRSGNRTTTVDRREVKKKLPPPNTVIRAGSPETGLIVKHGSDDTWKGDCFSPNCRVDLSDKVPFDLPDWDVFAIDADGAPPAEIENLRVSGVGTVLFDMVVAQDDGWSCWSSPFIWPYPPRPCHRIFVSNTEARNQVRFESMLTGSFSESRITEIGIKANYVEPVAFNDGAADGMRLASPMGMALASPGFANRHRPFSFSDPRSVSLVGRTRRSLYVAGFGSNNVGVFSTADLAAPALIDLEQGADFNPELGKGPTGLVLDEERNCLYVMNRFDHSISVVCPADRAAEARVLKTEWLPDPSPPDVYLGRRFLYDARHTSKRGDSSCASCHVFGDLDDLAWDLGEPGGTDVFNINPFIDDPSPECLSEPCRSTRIPRCEQHPATECTQDSDCPSGPCRANWPRFCNFAATRACSVDADCFVVVAGRPVQGQCIGDRRFATMKGPMTTQSLRGLKDAGPMHWRGDRFKLEDPLDEDAAFEKFNPAFVSLLGKQGELKDFEMDAFREFVMTLRYPPNPIAALDGSTTRNQTLFFDEKTDLTVRTCEECHRVPLGTSGFSNFEMAPQELKIPHLRNMYQKVGMTPDPATKHAIRGFGYTHDGSVPSLFAFLNIELFTFPGDSPATPTTPAVLNDVPRKEVENIMLEFATGLAPVVGQQVTLGGPQQFSAGDDHITNVLIPRAEARDCDLVVKGLLGGKWRGWLYVPIGNLANPSKTFRRDDGTLFQDSAIRAEANLPGQERTYTCVPPGSGKRIGIDRDVDGVLDGKDGSSEPPKHSVQ